MEVDGWKVGTVATGILSTLLGWLGARNIAKIEALEKTSVSWPEMKEHFEMLRTERQEMHEENKRAMTRMEAKLDATEFSVLASRLARAETELLTLREWRNAKVDAELGEFKFLLQRVEMLERGSPTSAPRDRRRTR